MLCYCVELQQIVTPYLITQYPPSDRHTRSMTMAIRTHDDDDDDEEEQEDGDGMCLMKIGGTKGSVAIESAGCTTSSAPSSVALIPPCRFERLYQLCTD